MCSNRLVQKCGLLLLFAVGFAANVFAQTASRPTQSDGKMELKQILAHEAILLSCDGKSAVQNFTLRLIMRSVLPDATETGMDSLIVYNRGAISILVRSLDGIPFLYMAKGLLVQVDPDNPETFLLSEDGSPRFVWLPENGKEQFSLSYVRDPAQMDLRVDLRGLIAPRAARATRSEWFDDLRTIQFDTPNTQNMVIFGNDRTDPIGGIREFITAVRGKGCITLRIATNNDGNVKPQQVTKEKLSALGIAVRARELQEGHSLLPPSKFGEDDRQKAAGKKLDLLFPSRQIDESLAGTPEESAMADITRAYDLGIAGKLDEAIICYTHAIQTKNAQPAVIAKALTNRGLVYGQMGLHDKEIADYAQIIELSTAPREMVVRALVNRGIARGNQNDYDKAIDDYSRAIAMKEANDLDMAQALFKRGLAYGKKSQFNEAIADESRVIQMNAPDVAEFSQQALVARGYTRLQAGEIDAGRADLSEYLASNPNGELAAFARHHLTAKRGEKP